MSEQRSKAFFFWLLLLFVLNLVYLVYELAFNSRLVDAAVASLSDLQVRALELEGRTLSGIGLSLLLLRLIKVQGVPLLRTVRTAALCILIGFPSMYFGQRILVDQLVDRTTAEQRMDAQLLVLMKRGLATNALQLEGIEFDEQDLDSAHTRSFLSVLGLMTFVSPEFVDELKANAERIIAQVAVNEATRAVPEAYEHYRELQRAVLRSWEDYEQLSDEYWNAQAELAAKADKEWLELQAKLLAQWEELAPVVDEHAFRRRVLALQRNLENYFKAREACDNVRVRAECLIKVEDIYRTEVTQALGRYVAPTDWCHDPEFTTVTTRRGARFFTERHEVQQCRDLSYEHLAGKLSEMTGAPASYDLFLADADVSARVRTELAASGIDLPSDWRADDRAGFVVAVLDQWGLAVGEQVEESMRETLGTTLPLDLDVQAFLASDPIQSRLHQALRPMDPTMILRVDYSPEAFRDAVITPHFMHVAEREQERLYSAAQEMGNGGPREEEGKRYVRALIVPPIAMGFSLFFALINAVGLIAGIPALLGWKRPLLIWSVKLGGVAAIIAIPMINNAAVVETDTYKYFETEVRRSLTPAAGFFTTWVINTEPAVYAVGRFTAYVAPPLFPVDPDEADEQESGIAVPEIDTRVEYQVRADALDQPSAPMRPESDDRELVPVEPPRLMRVAHLSALTPLEPQALAAAEGGKNAVMIDVQQLRDGAWAVHRSPIITGQGTCLTIYQSAFDISRMASLHWRTVKHGTCGSEAIARRPVSIPLAPDFARQIRRRIPDAALWVHFQPTLHGEVFCHNVRQAAEEISAIMGPGRFAAAVSTPETLSCFARVERDYPLAYFGPEYGDASHDVEATPRHLSMQEIRNLRGRARGEGYREHALAVSRQVFDPVLGTLDEGDFIIVHHQHYTPFLESFLDGFTGRKGVFLPTGAPDADKYAEHAVVVTRSENL